MKAWLQHNVIALVLVIASAVGVYTAMKTEQDVNRAEILALQRTVQMQEEVLSEIPALKRDILYITREVTELKPIMAGLSKGINSLNVTLAKLEGRLESSPN